MTAQYKHQVLPSSHYLYNEINKIVLYDTPITRDATPGFIIGIIAGDSTYVLSIGQRSQSDTNKIMPSDRFQIGSISKVFTATLFALLDQSNDISLRSSIADLLPANCRSEIMSEITISDLLSHQSRLPKYPSNLGTSQSDLKQPYKEYGTEDICAYLKSELKTNREPTYSHLNYAILELLLEEQTGRSYSALANIELFDVLGMEQSAFEKHAINLVEGVNRGARKASPWLFNSFLASEGAVSTLNDLIQFLKWNLSDSHDQKTQQVINALHTPIGQSLSGTEIETCLGWQLYYPKKKWPVYVHTGRSSGHHSYIGFCKRSSTGVVILSNGANGTYELGALILRMINHNWKKK